MTRKQAVLKCLIGSVNGVPNYVIQSVEIGGCAGLRRVRELREAGIKIDAHRQCKLVAKNGKWESIPTGSYLYHLITPVAQIDVENCCLKGWKE